MAFAAPIAAAAAPLGAWDGAWGAGAPIAAAAPAWGAAPIAAAAPWGGAWDGAWGAAPIAAAAPVAVAAAPVAVAAAPVQALPGVQRSSAIQQQPIINRSATTSNRLSQQVVDNRTDILINQPVINNRDHYVNNINTQVIRDNNIYHYQRQNLVRDNLINRYFNQVVRTQRNFNTCSQTCGRLPGTVQNINMGTRCMQLPTQGCCGGPAPIAAAPIAAAPVLAAAPIAAAPIAAAPIAGGCCGGAVGPALW